MGQLFKLGCAGPTPPKNVDCTAIHIPARDAWKGKIELRGLAEGKYRVHDYANDKDLGELDAANPTIDAEFTGSLLVETVKE